MQAQKGLRGPYPRNLFNLISHEKKIKEVLGARVPSERLSSFFARKNDAIYNMAARTVRYHAQPYLDFRRMLQMAMTSCKLSWAEEYLKGYPLIVLAPKTDELRVFTNVILDDTSATAIKYCSYLVYDGVLKSFSDKYSKDLESIHARAGWHPLHRAWGKIKKREDMPTSRALQRFTKLGSSLTPAQLRDVAASMDEMRKPVELIYPQKEEEIIRMYADGPKTCMSCNGSHDKGWSWMWKTYKTHPCAFYLYHPYIKPVYMLFKGKVAGRSFLYQQEDGRWCYGRIFAESDKMHETFENALKTAGNHPLSSARPCRHPYYRQVTFRMPTIDTKEMGRIAALPYLDNFVPNMSYAYDEETKEVIVTVDKKIGKPNVAITTAAGFVKVDTLINKPCGYCGAAAAGGRLILTTDGQAFCSEKHAFVSNYFGVYRSDHTRVYMPSNSPGLIRDIAAPYTAYSNLDAAHRNGAYSLIDDGDIYNGPEQEDTENVTSQCYALLKRGDTYWGLSGEAVRNAAGELYQTDIKNDKSVYIVQDRYPEHVFPKVKIDRKKEVALEENYIRQAA